LVGGGFIPPPYHFTPEIPSHLPNNSLDTYIPSV
jgi:hypothetical protein